MPVRLSQRQLDFFRELLFPFPDSAYFETRGYTYLKARTIEIRLDDVVGPLGWVAEYVAIDGGQKCRLKILCPDDTPDGWAWHYKENGGGEEGMTKKTGGAVVEDTDNDTKSAFTNAFRRAAIEWGIGRELYKEGVPRWLSDLYPNEPRVSPAAVESIQAPKAPTPAQSSAPAPESPRPAPPQSATTAPAREIIGRPRDVPVDPPTQQPNPVAPPQPTLADADRKIPRAGRGVWAWATRLHRHFDVKLIDAMLAEARRMGWPTQFNEWTQEQVNGCAMAAIRLVATLPTYHGEFAEVLAADTGPAAPAPKAAVPGVNIADVRKELAVKLKALIHKQTGRPAETAEMAAMFKEFAPQCKTAEGHTGEVPASLNGVTDLTWLRNMHAFVDDQIAAAVQTQVAGGEDIPF